MTFPLSYPARLRLRLWGCLGLAACGLLLLAVLLTLGLDRFSNDLLRGYLVGVGLGTLTASCITAFRTRHTLRHLETARRAEIEENDERRVTIIRLTCTAAIPVLCAALLIASVIAALTGAQTVLLTLLGCGGVLLLTLLGGLLVFRRLL